MESIGPLMATASGTRSSRRCERLTPRAEAGELFFLLAAHKLLQMLRVPGALHRDSGDGAIDVTDIVGCQFDGSRSDVLFQTMQLGRAGDGNNPRLLSQQPGDRDLSRRCLFLGADLAAEPDGGYLQPSLRLCIVLSKNTQRAVMPGIVRR
jgi:hypothetical protein